MQPSRFIDARSWNEISLLKGRKGRS